MERRSRGRPKKLNPLGDAFRALYKDPLFSPEDICAVMGISRATYHRYEKELDIPTVRVAIGNSSGLPLVKARRFFPTELERYDLHVIRGVGSLLDARIKLVPVSLHNRDGEKALESKSVDFLIASMSWTKERAKTLYFSESYTPDETPHGMIYSMPSQELPTGCRLGVLDRSVHEEHARAHFSNQFTIVPFVESQQLVKALVERKVAAVLAHPLFTSLLTAARVEYEARSRKIVYDSRTAILFHADSELWRPSVNAALDELFESGHLDTQLVHQGFNVSRY